jgi:serine protease Do
MRKLFFLFSALTIWSSSACAAVPTRELPDFTALVEQNSAAVVNISSTALNKPSENKSKDKDKDKKGDSGKQRPSPRDFGIPENSPFFDFFRRFMDEDDDNHSESPLPPRRKGLALGSGFIMSADGYIVTNHHVIDNAEKIIVKLSDRRELEAKLIGSDERSDLALLKVEATNLPTVKLGSSQKLKVGEWVLAIGSPFGFDHSVTAGIVSAKGRSLPDGNSNYIPFIQTDVAINPGNSGGPLFNLQGEVVGVNAQIYSRTGGFMGLSFTIPIDIATSVLQQLKEKGKVARGWLGVLIQDVNRDLAESFGMLKPYGALISKIMDGPAKAAGFEVGDIVLQFNGIDVVYSHDLPPIVGSTAVGSTVPVKVMRQGKEMILQVAVAELPADSKLESMNSPSGGKMGGEKDKRLGLSVANLTDEERKKLDLPDGGVIVRKIDSDSPASDTGLRTGDVISQFNRVKVENVKQFMELAEGLQAGQTVPLLIQRQGSALFLAIKVPKAKKEDKE